MSGIPNISIGDTICREDKVIPMETIKIEEPTMSMNFLINTSPFAGLSGKYVTTRHLKSRLEKELEVNVGLRVEALEGAIDGYKAVSYTHLDVYKRQRIDYLLKNKDYLEEVYRMGAGKAEATAIKTLRKVQKKVGFIPR